MRDIKRALMLILSLGVIFVIGCSSAGGSQKQAIMPFTKIHENIFLFKDSVNVYVIKDGRKAVLIDFGSGKILNYLPEIGVNKIDYILHTHYHRDQCYGDRDALKQKIKIAAPSKEKKLFTEAENFWKIKSYYDIYSLQPTFFVSTFNVPLDLTFSDKDEFEWESYKFKVIETAGHTTGSVSYLIETNKKVLAFTGDLIHSGGKILIYYDLEYSYSSDGGDIGIKLSLASFEKLLAHTPDVLLPSHGDIITEPGKEIDVLKKKFQNVISAFRLDKITRGNIEGARAFLKQLDNIDDRYLFPHIIHKGFGTSFIILGNHQNCILIDFPGDGDIFKYNYEQLENILKENNIKKIDFVIPTHYHDDHIAGIPLLQQKYNIKVYALENMADVLENPTHYRIGCLIDTPIKVDRVLKDGEVFKWDDYEFQVFHFPGQTEYHMGLFGKIDGKTAFFVGDSMQPGLLNWPETNNNCINFCQLGENVGSVKCADILLKCNPDYLVSGHLGYFKFDKTIMHEYKKHVAQYKSVIADIVAQDNPNMGFDPNWICFKPIRIITKPGSECKTNLIVRNYLDKESTIEIVLNLPGNWSSESKNITCTIGPKTFKEIPISFKIPENENPKGRTIITANIKWNGKDIGPFPDLMIDHGYTPSDSWKAWTPDKKTDLFQWIINSYERDAQFFKP
jgi:glyoxylase-like metal-dependent hydrolase (beta-lactamase superfamily II)